MSNIYFKKKQTTLYRTKDFYHAVVLKTLGYVLSHVDRSSDKFSVFVFEDKDKTAELEIGRYWERDLMIDPRTMVESIHELKTRLYSI